jgi:hypothetical protein
MTTMAAATAAATHMPLRLGEVLLCLCATALCVYAAFTAVAEMSWLRALDVALQSYRSSEGEDVLLPCVRNDERLLARARRFPEHDAEVLISDSGTSALFVGTERTMICLRCVRDHLDMTA